jgi:hypothetical protein
VERRTFLVRKQAYTAALAESRKPIPGIGFPAAYENAGEGWVG